MAEYTCHMARMPSTAPTAILNIRKAIAPFLCNYEACWTVPPALEIFSAAEVENLVEVGELEPDLVHTPGIYVNRVVKGESYEKWIEKHTVRPKPQA